MNAKKTLSFAPRLKIMAWMMVCMGILILSLSLVKAEEVYKGGDQIDLKVQCLNNNTYCSNAAVCNLTVTYPNNSILIDNLVMTNQIFYHNYTLSKSHTWLYGDYGVNVICLDNTVRTEPITFNFTITPTGFKGTLGFFIFIVLVGYLILIIGIYKEDIALTMLGSFCLFLLGLFILIYGVDIYKNVLTEGFAIITLGIAAYISIRMGLEYVQ